MGGELLVGRRDELAVLLDTVAGIGPPYAVLTAGPGMGKTSVMAALLARAEGLRVRILSAAPTELERKLGFCALADLLGSCDEDLYDELPAPQRTALRAALLLEEAPGDIDPRAVAAAFRAVLGSLARERPLALVIDDAHWLDGATTQALGHALRRSTGLPIRVVAATRPVGRGVDDWLPARPEERADVPLGPMRPDELGTVVRHVVGTAVDRSSLPGLAAASEGNPLFAIEVVQRRGHPAHTTTFDELLSRRLGVLPRETRSTLLTAALAGTPTLDVVAAARATTPEDVETALEPAVRAGLVSVLDRIRFAHPLYASGLTAVSSEAQVRAAHAGLVDVDVGDEVRARHRGLAAQGEDAELAADLERVARAARRRGAWDTAIDLMELAVRRSPVGGELAERALLLGSWLALAGRPDNAAAWLRRAHKVQATAHRAGLELLRLALRSGSGDEVDALVRELTTLGTPLLVRTEAQILDLDRHSEVTSGERAARLQRINAELMELGDDPAVQRLLARGLLMEAADCLHTGSPAWHSAVDRARAIEEVVMPALVVDRVDYLLAEVAIIGDRHDEARRRLRDLLAASEELGDDLSLPTLLGQRSWLEWRVGNWDLSDELLREAATVASGQHQRWENQARVGLAVSRGLRGDIEGALAELDASFDDVRQPLPTYPIASWWASRAQVLKAGGRIEEAYEHFVRAQAEAARSGVDVPGILRADAPYMECAITLGRLDEAADHLGVVIDWTRRVDNPSVLVECSRIQVLLRAARGDLDEAVDMIPDMLAAHEDGVGPLQRGHAYLTAGRVYRRAKAKTLAHEALERAAGIYDELGAAPYAEQARAELARVGLRPRASDELTDTERQAAELATTGLRNREIADRMFLSVKTVEAVLGRVYRKLGIRSRAELARTLAEGALDD